jgi:hypothetical protein
MYQLSNHEFLFTGCDEGTDVQAQVKLSAVLLINSCMQSSATLHIHCVCVKLT